jgi:hypothetical protein
MPMPQRRRPYVVTRRSPLVRNVKRDKNGALTVEEYRGPVGLAWQFVLFLLVPGSLSVLSSSSSSSSSESHHWSDLILLPLLNIDSCRHTIISSDSWLPQVSRDPFLVRQIKSCSRLSLSSVCLDAFTTGSRCYIFCDFSSGGS